MKNVICVVLCVFVFVVNAEANTTKTVDNIPVLYLSLADSTPVDGFMEIYVDSASLSYIKGKRGISTARLSLNKKEQEELVGVFLKAKKWLALAKEKKVISLNKKIFSKRGHNGKENIEMFFTHEENTNTAILLMFTGFNNRYNKSNIIIMKDEWDRVITAFSKTEQVRAELRQQIKDEEIFK